MTRSLGGQLNLDALATLTGRDRFRPLDRQSMRAAVMELAAHGLKPADIASALSLSNAMTAPHMRTTGV